MPAKAVYNKPEGIVVARRSPSPRPSPAGRGRIVARLSKKQAAGFAGWSSENIDVYECCPLSQRERVRVRENSTVGFTYATELLKVLY